MCQEQLIYDPRTVDPKCWGYLSIRFTGYTFMPMTVSGGNPPITPLPIILIASTSFTGAFTCVPGAFPLGSTCAACGFTLPSSSTWANPGKDCSAKFL